MTIKQFLLYSFDKLFFLLLWKISFSSLKIKDTPQSISISMQRNIFHSLFCSCLSQKGKDGTSSTVRSTQHLFTRYLFLRGNTLYMIRHYELIVFQTKSVHVLKDQILFSMWLYTEKHRVQIPRSLLVYLYEPDLLSECHYFTF